MNRRDFLILSPVCLASGLLPLMAGTQEITPANLPPRKVVFSGFEPFAGRKINASFKLAGYLAEEGKGLDCQAVEVPVVWGEPSKAVKKHWPGPGGLWVAFGEGFSQGVSVETVALNTRGDFPDNQNARPSQHEIKEGGSARLTQDFPVDKLVEKLRENGIAARASKSAGNYLCEEMLYELLAHRDSVKEKVPATVLFIHVPPWGSRTKTAGGEETMADEAWLRKLAKALMPAIAAAEAK